MLWDCPHFLQRSIQVAGLGALGIPAICWCCIGRERGGSPSPLSGRPVLFQGRLEEAIGGLPPPAGWHPLPARPRHPAGQIGQPDPPVCTLYKTITSQTWHMTILLRQRVTSQNASHPMGTSGNLFRSHNLTDLLPTEHKVPATCTWTE